MSRFEPNLILTAAELNSLNNDIIDVSTSHHDLRNRFIERIDTYEDVNVYQNANIDKPSSISWFSTYNWSSFRGWTGYCGCPAQFKKILFICKIRENLPISKFNVIIWEMPERSAITLSANLQSYTPPPVSWPVLATGEVTLEFEYIGDKFTTVTIEFKNTVVNTNNKHLFAGVYANNSCTFGIAYHNVTNAPFYPHLCYTTNGSAFGFIANQTINLDETKFKSVPFRLIDTVLVKSEETINTKSSGKFGSLVEQTVIESDAMNSIFEKKNKPVFVNGPTNLLIDKNYIISSPGAGRTFSGRIDAIGRINQAFDGIKLRICPRAVSGAHGTCTVVGAYLYEIPDDKIPITSLNIGGMSGSTLVRKGFTDCSVGEGEVADVNIFWEEGSYLNTNGKFLMLGWCLNSYMDRVCPGSTVKTNSWCGSIDGSTYGAMDSYYAATLITKGQTPGWSPRWSDNNMGAWSFINSRYVLDFGQKFYDMILEAIGQIETHDVPTSEVRLAKRYDVVVGDKFLLFYDGVIKTFDVLAQGVRVQCSVGKQFLRYFEFTPTSEHANKNYQLTLSTRRLDGSVISSAKTTIYVHPKLTDATTPSNINVLVFGDSLTGAGVWCSEGLRRIYGTASSGYVGPASDGVTNTVTTYGTKQNTNNTFTMKHEGYSGWTWGSFLATTSGTSITSQLTVVFPNNHGLDIQLVEKAMFVDLNNLQWELEAFPTLNSILFNRGPNNTGAQSSITLPTSLNCQSLGITLSGFSGCNFSSNNPFYDSVSGTISFTAHALRFNNPGADIVACLLTWNGGGASADFNSANAIQTHMTNAATLLSKIHTDLPNAKIIVMGIQISDLNGGTGAAYGATGTYSDMWACAFYAFDYNKALEDLVTSDKYKSYCYYVDTKGLFDSKYNMPANLKDVNARNSAQKEFVGTNGVHAYNAGNNAYDSGGWGYYHIGDAFYRKLTAIIPTLVNN